MQLTDISRKKGTSWTSCRTYESKRIAVTREVVQGNSTVATAEETGPPVVAVPLCLDAHQFILAVRVGLGPAHSSSPISWSQLLLHPR
jgi:hypothetical protein